ncbi:MAG: hypothetical protein HQ515_10600 [Phycisphaeraceae bacterium]|nr:hypothetical protein [Phycisphaeraceae bacterium]
MPADAEALYETTVFAANNDPLEMRSIQRSGPSRIRQVQKARQMFLDQEMIATRGIWDRFLFDDDPDTVYNFDKGFGIETERVIRLDLGRATRVDTLVYVLPAEEADVNRRANSGVTRLVREDHWVEVSSDLKTWQRASFVQLTRDVQINIGSDQSIRYIRTNFIPPRAVEILGQAGGKTLDRTAWRCSFFFRPYDEQPAIKAWSHVFTLNEASAGAYLCVALEGMHGKEGGYAALRVGDKIIGAPTRATSYPSNVWEYPVPRRDSHYTYFIPVTQDMVGQRIEAIVLGMDPEHLNFKPEVWLTAYAPPFASQELVLGVE